MVTDVAGRIRVFFESWHSYERGIATKEASLRKQAEDIKLLKLPDPLRTTGDISKNWKLFKQRLELYLTVTMPQDNPLIDAAKTALLLGLDGEDVIEVFKNFTFNEDESSECYGTVVQRFDSYLDAGRTKSMCGAYFVKGSGRQEIHSNSFFVM